VPDATIVSDGPESIVKKWSWLISIYERFNTQGVSVLTSASSSLLMFVLLTSDILRLGKRTLLYNTLLAVAALHKTNFTTCFVQLSNVT
jgi:hypothetical protein